MTALGYVNGRTVKYEWRSADGDFGRLPKLAAELVKSDVEVLVVQSTPAVRAALSVTKTIPIVFVGIGDPVATGLVASLAKPGGNATGVANLSIALDGKRVELVAEVLPGLSKIGVMLNPANPTYPEHVKAFTLAAKTRSLHIEIVPAKTPEDIDKGFETLRRERANALIVQVDTFFQQRRGQIAILAASARLPTMFGGVTYVEAGGLMSYAHRQADQYQKTAEYVDQILKGAKPSALPVEQSARFDLIINMRTARALGLKIPASVLARADQLIE